MTTHMTELEHLVKGLPDKERAKLTTTLEISDSTFRRWLKNPGKLIPIDGATIIKRTLDKVYKADHNMDKLARPIRVHGRRALAA